MCEQLCIVYDFLRYFVTVYYGNKILDAYVFPIVLFFI